VEALELLCGKIQTQLKTAESGALTPSPGLSSPIRLNRKDGLAVYSTCARCVIAAVSPAPGGAR
jgi:hypothetical protein